MEAHVFSIFPYSSAQLRIGQIKPLPVTSQICSKDKITWDAVGQERNWTCCKACLLMTKVNPKRVAEHHILSLSHLRGSVLNPSESFMSVG
ncbi:hypothetical protein TNCV_1875381 [Trichonephila clavipes]|nr:hypothetical protein TNCV_1875381 [Trichonephila clavipes]